MPSRYSQIIEKVFLDRFAPGMESVAFSRDDIPLAARELGIPLVKNIGDLVSTFRFRQPLPPAIRETAGQGKEWIIRLAGRGQYRFVTVEFSEIRPNLQLADTKVPDATPGIIAMYALTDEQALLAKVRYNRLVDIFTGVTCYSLQSHLRTTVPDVGQVETDEIYVGIDRRGAHYVLPVQAKRGNDKLGIVQIEQDAAMCASKFPHLTCRPIAAQFLSHDLIAVFELEVGADAVKIAAEKHYRLVPVESITPEDLARYRATLAT